MNGKYLPPAKVTIEVHPQEVIFALRSVCEAMDVEDPNVDEQGLIEANRILTDVLLQYQADADFDPGPTKKLAAVKA